MEEYGWGRLPTKSVYPLKSGMSKACKSIKTHQDCCSLSCTCDCHIVEAETWKKKDE